MSSCLHRLLPSLLRGATNMNSQSRFIHKSIPCLAGQNWRKKEGLPANPNAYGPLTDLPDYTFLDGRRTPVGAGSLKRAQEQEKLAVKIMKLSSEIDFAIDRRAALDKEEELRKQSIIGRKLKEKGDNFGRRSFRNPRVSGDNQ